MTALPGNVSSLMKLRIRDNSIRFRLTRIEGNTLRHEGSVSATLTLLLEKDFACLVEREGEDESDMFPHPHAGQNNG